MMAHARSISSCLARLITTALAASIPHSAVAADQDAAARATLPAFLVNEAEAGDLNGDGDSADSVLHLFDAKQGLTLNLGLAAASVCRSVLGPPFVICTPVSPVVGRTIIAFLVGELAQSETDLNGDGDASDDVLHVYDAAAGAIINTRLAAALNVGRDVSSYIFPVMPVVAGDGIAFLVGEVEQGGTDLNLDGDAGDDVLHVIEPRAHEILNLQLAAATVLGPFGARNAIWPQLNHHHVMFVAGEGEQGGVDLNGDGDTDDQVTYVLKVQSGRLRLARSVPSIGHPASPDVRAPDAEVFSTEHDNGGQHERQATAQARSPHACGGWNTARLRRHDRYRDRAERQPVRRLALAWGDLRGLPPEVTCTVSLVVWLGANTLDYPDGAGHQWVYLNWALGLRALGCQ